MKIQERRLARHFPLANFVILLLGIVVVLIGFLIESSELSGIDLRSLLVNIGADIIVVAVLFFLGKLLYIDPQEELNERLRKIEETDELAGKIAVRIQSELALPSEEFFKRRKDSQIEELLDGAKREIWVSGISLATMVMKIANLKSKLQQGYNLRFLALAPHGEAVQQGYELCSAGTTQVGRTQRGTLIANYLETLHSGLSSFVSREGQLEIRTVDRIPVFGFLITDASDAQSRMRVQIYPHQVEIGEAPLFELSKETDPKWYWFFRGQFEKLWDEGEGFRGQQQVVFHDEFDDFAGWQQYPEGEGNFVSLSTDYACVGSHSLKKDRARDPKGGYKEIGQSIVPGFVFSGWIHRPDVRTGADADRLAIEDGNHNGYGFIVAHYQDYVGIERRVGGTAKPLSERFSYTAPRGQWYRFEFVMTADEEIELRLFDPSTEAPSSFSVKSDGKYTSFDRVAVHGGFPYYVDELEVRLL